MKLRISEDTVSVPSKTTYIEDGFDKNGIYYFGKKPELPISWRELHKIKKLSNRERIEESMIISEQNNSMVTNYFEVDSKRVKDSGGWWTDYTMYVRVEADPKDWFEFLQNADIDNLDIPEEFITGYVFVFGDNEIYDPYDEDFDWECNTEEEAYKWFDNYTGFDDEEDEDEDYY